MTNKTGIETTTAEVAPADGRGGVTIDGATLRQVFWRWYFCCQLNENYEKMQASGYWFTMWPVLKKVYGDDENALQQASRNHLQFFNTSPQMCPLILGINCALEPKLGLKGMETIAGLKTGLMGPLAGIGDSLLGVVVQTVFGSIAAYQAMEGSPFGTILFICVGIAVCAFRWGLFRVGYREGARAAETITEQIHPITESASVLGLTVVGALVTTVVSITAPATFTMGDYSQPVQEMLDGILPGMLPLIAVLGVYALLSKKGMTSNKAIFIVIAVGLIFGCTGLLA